jgi:hypothetical protein
LIGVLEPGEPGGGMPARGDVERHAEEVLAGGGGAAALEEAVAGALDLPKAARAAGVGVGVDFAGSRIVQDLIDANTFEHDAADFGVGFVEDSAGVEALGVKDDVGGDEDAAPEDAGIEERLGEIAESGAGDVEGAVKAEVFGEGCEVGAIGDGKGGDDAAALDVAAGALECAGDIFSGGESTADFETGRKLRQGGAAGEIERAIDVESFGEGAEVCAAEEAGAAHDAEASGEGFEGGAVRKVEAAVEGEGGGEGFEAAAAGEDEVAVDAEAAGDFGDR